MRSSWTVAPRLSGLPISPGTSPATNEASGDPTIVSLGHNSRSASCRLAYRMSPLDETVAAPSRMCSTNIRYGRSAVNSVNTRRPDSPSETTKASTSPAPIARRVSSASAIRARASNPVVCAGSPSAAFFDMPRLADHSCADVENLNHTLLSVARPKGERYFTRRVAAPGTALSAVPCTQLRQFVVAQLRETPGLGLYDGTVVARNRLDASRMRGREPCRAR